jgi:hypothetical protein
LIDDGNTYILLYRADLFFKFYCSPSYEKSGAIKTIKWLNHTLLFYCDVWMPLNRYLTKDDVWCELIYLCFVVTGLYGDLCFIHLVINFNLLDCYNPSLITKNRVCKFFNLLWPFNHFHITVEWISTNRLIIGA